MRKLGWVLIVAAAACGDDGGKQTVDAGPDPDADIDAPVTGDPVTLTVTLDGSPVAGVRVHFQNPDSSLIASAMTDAAGVASSPMPNGGFVTAVNPFADPGVPFVDLFTYSDVEPGDDLKLAEFFGGNGIDLTFTLPADNTAGVDAYIVSTPCGDSSTTTNSLTLAVDSRCSTTTDVVVVSVDVNNEAVGWFYASNVASASGTIDLTASTYTAATSKTFTFDNIPAALGGINFRDGYFSGNGRVVEFLGAGDGTSVTQTLKVSPFANATEAIFASGTSAWSEHRFADWGPFSAATHTVDVGARLLRDATAGVSWDAATHQAGWTLAATGEVPEVTEAYMECYRQSSLYIYWTIVGAYDGTSIEYPVLPVEGTDYNCAAADTAELYVSLGKFPGGWDAIRENFFAIDGTEGLVSATPGSATIQEIGPAGGLFAPLRRALSTVRAPRKHGAFAWKSTRRM